MLTSRVWRRLAIVLAGALVGMTWQHPANAEDSVRRSQRPPGPTLPVPTFARCDSATPPVLPQRWHAVGLMAPFTNGQLDVGEFVYDDALPAMRATIYGLESGTIDLLIADANTYQLLGPYRAPTGCVSLGRRFDPPSARWLSAQARCVGKAPVAATQVEWWKTPSDGTAATWHWYKTGARLPWRAMMTVPSRDPAVIGEYAMTYFPTFEQVSRTNLAQLRDFCRAQPEGSRDYAAMNAQNVRALMTSRRDEVAEAERAKRIELLIPGLSQRACSGVKPSQWPGRFGMTAIMIPTTFAYGPYPAEVFYDWDGANAQLTRLHDPENPSSRAAIEALLMGGIGYDVRRHESGAVTCRQAYPGLIRPDWMTNDRCECRGVIRNNAALGAKDVIVIQACPVMPSGVFWALYTHAGRPVAFRSTALDPEGLTLADYYGWAPAMNIAPGMLDPPAECAANDAFARDPQLQDRFPIPSGAASRCSGCHVASGP